MVRYTQNRKEWIEEWSISLQQNRWIRIIKNRNKGKDIQEQNNEGLKKDYEKGKKHENAKQSLRRRLEEQDTRLYTRCLDNSIRVDREGYALLEGYNSITIRNVDVLNLEAANDKRDRSKHTSNVL